MRSKPAQNEATGNRDDFSPEVKESKALKIVCRVSQEFRAEAIFTRLHSAVGGSVPAQRAGNYTVMAWPKPQSPADCKSDAPPSAGFSHSILYEPRRNPGIQTIQQSHSPPVDGYRPWHCSLV